MTDSPTPAPSPRPARKPRTAAASVPTDPTVDTTTADDPTVTMPAAATPVSPTEQLLSIDVSAVPGFFRALVDFRFTTFITRRIAGFIYAILLVSIVLSALVAFFSIVVTGVGLLTGGQPVSGVLTVLGALVLVPVAALVAIVLARMIVEINVALIAIAENTAGLRRP